MNIQDSVYKLYENSSKDEYSPDQLLGVYTPIYNHVSMMLEGKRMYIRNLMEKKKKIMVYFILFSVLLLILYLIIFYAVSSSYVVILIYLCIESCAIWLLVGSLLCIRRTIKHDIQIDIYDQLMVKLEDAYRIIAERAER